MISFNDWCENDKRRIMDNLYLVEDCPFFSPQTRHLNSWLSIISSNSIRIKPCAWCVVCEHEIAIDNQGDDYNIDNHRMGHIGAYTRNNGEFVLEIKHDTCCLLDKNVNKTTPFLVTLGDLRRLKKTADPCAQFNKFCTKHKIPESCKEKIKRQLYLLGFVNKDELGARSRVYFCTDGLRIKIGYTEQDVNKRIKDLQTACSAPISLLATIPGHRKTESALHKRFKPYRKNGEWFDPHTELVQYIESISDTSASGPGTTFGNPLSDAELKKAMRKVVR